MGGPDSLQIGIPGGGDNATSVVRNRVSIFVDARRESATAVNPLEVGGAQFIMTIGGPGSPKRYAYPLSMPEGGTLHLTEDGGAEVVLEDGSLAATVPAPWAVDADQRPVRTHFEAVGNSLVQVVDHTSENAYPVTADPSVFGCDWHTHTCVKFTRTETKDLALFGTPLVVAAGAIALRLCTKIPADAISYGCTAVVAPFAFLLVNSFRGAASAGKCVEMHFSRGIGPALWWKTEGC